VSEKPVNLRAQAEQDIQKALDYCVQERGSRAAVAWVDALERAFRHISRHPASGSTRYAYELDIPELRSWVVDRHPYVIFYVERAEDIDVWRILHGQRDLPGTLRSSD
jgi:toxin ParE1/3/4